MKKRKQLLVVGFGVVQSMVLYAQSASSKLEVTDARPLAAACTKIQKLSWIPINYEHVPYAYTVTSSI